ncbi:MAG: GldG family protein, partial [Bdellovibrionales bacterium]
MSKWGKISWVVFVISLVVLFTARLLLQGWMSLLYAPLVIALVSFLAALAVDYKYYLEFMSLRTTKHGMNMGVLILFATVLLVALNFLGVRHQKSFDLTKEKINSLSDQSLSIMKSLQSDMTVRIFYKGKQLKERALEIKNDFRIYMSESSHLKVEVVDANSEVELAKKYLENAEAFASIVEFKGKRTIIASSGGTPDRPIYSEKEITTAFNKITKDRVMNVFFTTGHGEKDFDQTGLEGLKAFSENLRNDGYTVTKLNLIGGDKMPEPPAVIAIVGPKTAFSDSELTSIRDFAKKGGKLFVAIDPGEKHQLALLTKTFGVEFKNNYVFNDVSGSDEGNSGALGLDFDKTSEITQKMSQGRSVVIFPFASEIIKAIDAPKDYIYNELIKSAPVAYHLNAANASSKGAEHRVHTLAVSVKNDKFSGVFLGDSDFLSDVRLNRWMHLDLAMNSIAFLFDDGSNITIRPKNLEGTQLQVTSEKGIMIAIAGVS